MDALWAPFAEFDFMARALAGGIALALAAAPLGVFLVLRRMSLVGDAIGHAILPGAAGAALLSGGATLPVTLGAAATGALVFTIAGAAGRALRLPDDAGLAVFYLAALALGVIIASLGGGAVDLDRLLFGGALGLDDTALILAASAATVSLVGVAILYRPLLLDTVDATFLRQAGGGGATALAIFFGLLALTTVASFHALGALMAVGLTILPAIGARYWAGGVGRAIAVAAALGIFGVWLGLSASFRWDLPAGAAIVLALVGLSLLSALLGPNGSVLARNRRGHGHDPHPA
jgi:zinc/manganese transport system permease protein